MYKYNGTTNSDEYIDAYVTQGITLNWYTRLPPNSIDLFETLVEKFGAQYAISRPHHLTLVALMNLRQDEDESLHTFTKRFPTVAIKIRNLSLEVALYSMITTLKPVLFSNSLCKKSPTSMDNLRTRASKNIQMEEMAEFRDHVRAEHAIKPQFIPTQFT
ncbi:hypothetical protein CR513_08814, partial [Mucuna pruriens]